jgi:hypothetical protein
MTIKLPLPPRALTIYLLTTRSLTFSHSGIVSPPSRSKFLFPTGIDKCLISASRPITAIPNRDGFGRRYGMRFGRN